MQSNSVTLLWANIGGILPIQYIGNIGILADIYQHADTSVKLYSKPQNSAVHHERERAVPFLQS